jgi:hypothetical protein
MFVSMCIKGASGRDSCAASESVFGEAPPNRNGFGAEGAGNPALWRGFTGRELEKHSFPRSSRSSAPFSFTCPRGRGPHTEGAEEARRSRARWPAGGCMGVVRRRTGSALCEADAARSDADWRGWRQLHASGLQGRNISA